jgi:ERCC4-related helicase
MKQFREGGYNTLVSTCVGEEGLDIGDVDLIICFDAHKSPIRLVQRMGRTGRKREGRIVMLVTQGKEEQVNILIPSYMYFKNNPWILFFFRVGYVLWLILE